jgi:4-hydroxy-3-methylbut-2-enyl diphosphate reductase
VDSYLIDNAEEINHAWLEGKHSIGVTAGASAPEILVQQVIDTLKQQTPLSVHKLNGMEENVSFSLPRALRVSD